MHHLSSSVLFAFVVAAVPEPSIISVKYTGNGCPRNAASYSTSTLDPSSNLIKLIHYLNEFTPVYGAGIALRDGQKQCLATVDIVVDAAYKLRVNNFGTNVNGYVRLAYLGHDLRITANYTFTTDTSVQVSLKTTVMCSHEKIDGADTSLQSTSQSIVRGPWNGRFTGSAPVVGNKVGVESSCGGGTLQAILKADINARGEGTGGGWVGNPAPSEDDWGFMADIEVLTC